MPDKWYLRTQDDTFGPETRERLLEWARMGRIQPGQEISSDGENWSPAEEIPFLDMRWSIDIGDGTPRGPFNKQAAEALLRSGRLPAGSKLVETVPAFEEEESDSGEVAMAPVPEDDVQTVVEQDNDISKPQIEVKVVEKIVEVPVEKVVEKIVEVPVEKIVAISLIFISVGTGGRMPVMSFAGSPRRSKGVIMSALELANVTDAVIVIINVLSISILIFTVNTLSSVPVMSFAG